MKFIPNSNLTCYEGNEMEIPEQICFNQDDNSPVKNQQWNHLIEQGIGLTDLHPVLFRSDTVVAEDDGAMMLMDYLGANINSKYGKCLDTFLRNIVRAYVRGFDGLFVPRDKNHYKNHVIINGVEIQTTMYHGGILKALKELEDGGMIISVQGIAKSSTCFCYGYVLFTDTLKTYLDSCTLDKGQPELNLVRLKRASGKSELKTFKRATPDVRDTQLLLRDYNRFMDDVDIHLNGIPLVTETHRMFIGNFNKFGRFQAPYQNLKSEERKYITFGMKQTCEIDLKASHPTILYARKNISLLNWDCYDPCHFYEHIPEKFQSSNGCMLTRTAVKLAIMCAINTSSRAQAVQAMAGDKYLSSHYGKGHGFYQALLDAICIVHEPIEEFFFQDCSLDLMFTESKIIKGIIKDSVEHKIPRLFIHDSVICEKEDAPRVELLFNDYFLKTWGVRCNVRVKESE